MRRILLLVLLFVVPSVFGQSVAEAARQNRPKGAKTTSKRVFTDDDFRHSASPDEVPVATTSKQQLAESMDDAERAISRVEDKTERELANDVVRDIQFPGRPAWEHRLYLKKQSQLASARALLAVVNSKASSASAISSARSRFDWDTTGYNEIKVEGIAKAAEWEKKTGR
jgi:hypothetical protein